MTDQFFIRKASQWSATNKLQKAVLAAVPAYYNQLVRKPQTLVERLATWINYLNRQFPRCSPLKVERRPLGSYGRSGSTPELRQAADEQQGLTNGWMIVISNLVELELQPVKGTLTFTEPDRYAFTLPGLTSTKTGQHTSVDPAQQMSVFD